MRAPVKVLGHSTVYSSLLLILTSITTTTPLKPTNNVFLTP